jgi:hypothetical protein
MRYAEIILANEIYVTQSKAADGTVRPKALSISSADSTLQIVKERQPISRSNRSAHSMR